jgi:carboxymethylenebutenolidase
MSEGILYRPERGRRWLGIIHLTDIGGIRPAHCDMARRLAAEGYTVLMPNVFYRTGRPPCSTSSRAWEDTSERRSESQN